MTQDETSAYKAQRLRLHRFSLAAASYVVGGALLLAVSALGSDLVPITPTVAFGFMALAIASNAVFYLMFRRGINLRFADPSLTIPQMVVGVLLITYLIYFAGPYRGLLSIFYLALMTFGLFHLNTRQLLGVSAFTVAAFAFTAVLLELRHPDAASFVDLVAQMLVLGGLLP